LQVLPVSLRVFPSSNKSSLRPWPVVQIDGSSLSSQIHSLCTLPKHGILPSSLLLKRNCVERALTFSVLIRNNVLQEVQRLTTWWQFTLCHCCCSLKWWLKREYIIQCHEACVRWGYLMSLYCRVWRNNGKCGDTLLGHFLQHFERIQLSTVGGGPFTTRTLNVRGDPLGTNFKEVTSEKRKISIQICWTSLRSTPQQ
jgi:hypothetical protein